MATANAIFAPGQPKKSAPLPLCGRKEGAPFQNQKDARPFQNRTKRRLLLLKPKNKGLRPLPNRKVKGASPFQTKAACRPPLSKPNEAPSTSSKAKKQRAAAPSKPERSAAPAAFCTKKEEFCLHLSQNRAAARAIFESLLKSKEMCAILYPVNIWIGRKILCLFKSRG